MKKILSLLIFIITTQASAHVFFKNDPIYSKKPYKYKVPSSEYYYIRIMPSPVMEGFASFELCPLIQDIDKNHTMNQWLLYREGQNLDSNNYHHDLILPQCQRPYQTNSLSKQIYFDLRDLDRILSKDNRKEKMIVGFSLAGGAIAGLATGGLAMPFLVGFVATTATSYAGYELTNSAMNEIVYIDRDWMLWTRVEYFTGVQGLNGSDLFWPVTPAEIPTFNECYHSCQQRENKAQIEKERKLANQKWDERKIILEMPSETTNNMNPLYGKSICELECRRYPSKRSGIKQIWKDLYLDTIYMTGHEEHMDQFPVKNDLPDAESKDLYDRYHTGKHFDWSAWEPVIEASGKKVPNHFTHKGNVINHENRYYLCSYLRFNAFEIYQALGGKLSYEAWQTKGCNFSRHNECRDYYDSDVQSGKEICTTIMD